MTATLQLFNWLTTIYVNASGNENWQVLIVVTAYLCVVLLTNRTLISAPARHQLVQQIDEERAELLLSLGDTLHRDDPGKHRLFHREAPSHGLVSDREKEIGRLLDRAEGGVCTVSRRRRRSRMFATLAQVLAGRRYLHAAQRMRAFYVKPLTESLFADATIVASKLDRTDTDEARDLASAIRRSTAKPQ